MFYVPENNFEKYVLFCYYLIGSHLYTHYFYPILGGQNCLFVFYGASEILPMNLYLNYSFPPSLFLSLAIHFFPTSIIIIESLCELGLFNVIITTYKNDAFLLRCSGYLLVYTKKQQTSMTVWTVCTHKEQRRSATRVSSSWVFIPISKKTN